MKIRQWIFSFTLLVGVAAFALPSIAQEKVSKPITTPTAEDNYQINVGDVLDITVWNNEELNMTVVVDYEGNLHYPFLGMVDSTNMTISDLEAWVTKGLDKELIVNPEVTIRLNPQSMAFFVYGEVRQPGTYQYRGNIDVLKAIVMAGGFTPFASKKVKIIRLTDEGSEIEIEVNAKILIHAMNDRNEYAIKPGDTIIVKRSWF